MSTPKLIIFDLGRVLVRICDNWQHACEVAKVTKPFKEPDDAGKQRLHELVCASEVGALKHEEFCAGAAAVFEVDPAHVRAMSDAYLLDAFEGVRELIDDLHTRGFQTACLSNTNASHWRLMSDPTRRCALPLDRLTFRFPSHEVRLRKPDDALYAHVEAASGRRGDEILFFDDLADNLEPARRRGWRVGQILPHEDSVAQIRRRIGQLVAI